MKQFLKYVLATVVGTLIVGIFMSVLGLMMVGVAVATGEQKPSLSEGTVLHITLSGEILERSTPNPLGYLTGSTTLQTQGLDDLLTAIRVAKTNDKVKGIYIEGGAVSADLATLQALRRAIVDFKKSKKFVYAYANLWSEGAYYVASAADKVAVDPAGMLDWHGLSSQPIFFTDLLKKVGVKVQVFKVGTYKSFSEPFVLTQMSDANRAQTESFLNDIWQGVTADVSASRRVSTERLNAFADNYALLADPADYVKQRLIDTLTYVDGVRDALRLLSGEDKVKFITPAQLAQLDKPASASDEVVVYYAEGDIVSDPTTSIAGGTKPQIVGSKVISDLDKLANDDKVKAVVLRINSGGGSAAASEQMWRAIQLLKKKKPVVVSMGGMAASGGYYMSCGADYIVAEPMTLTGSIGIFALIPDGSELLKDKLGLHFDVVKTNESADFGRLGLGLNDREGAAMQGYVDRGYRLFLSRVAQGRHMTPEAVDKIAQGRVWTGRQALGIKLVDRLGGLDVAVAEAARRAKLTDYRVISSPEKPSWLSQLMEKTVKKDYMEEKVRLALGDYYEPVTYVLGLTGGPSMQARIFFDPNIK